VIKSNSTLSDIVLRKGEEIDRIGNHAVQSAQEENRRLGIPNVYSINGVLYWELADGTLSRTDPYENQSNGKDSNAPSSA
jgi:hypothetical protein